MAAVLGVSALYHDAAAALVVDGRVVAAIQEERLTRIKNDPSLPTHAMQECLRLGGLGAGELTAVVFYENPFRKLERVLDSHVSVWPRGIGQFPRAIRSQLGGKIWVLDRLSEVLGVPRSRVRHVEHHASHAASTFYPSGFEEAAVLVVDAVGESDATSLWSAERGAGLVKRASIEFPHSLGLLYAAVTAYLGFAVNEGEYKVMALASYGEPRFRDSFTRVLKVSQGEYTLDAAYFAQFADSELGFGPKLEELLGPRRTPGRPWRVQDEDDRRYIDIAATLQSMLEETLMGLAQRAFELTLARNLCLAGGVALNCVANARLLREGPFERVFVQPAAGDAGGALGAALLGAAQEGDVLFREPFDAALGSPVDVARGQAIAEALGLNAKRVADPAQALARLLEEDRVIGLCCGRFEFGPRALGRRSIVALPKDASVRDQINRVIKEREAFRPFAPAALADDAARYFVGVPNDMTPFMTTTAQVVSGMRSELEAVVHVDGSARVQTVDANTGTLGQALALLRDRGRPPVVLNTSLNGQGEPIVATSADALAFFLGHPIDCMLVGDLLIERRRP